MDDQIQTARLRNSQVELLLKGLELVHDMGVGFDDEIKEIREALKPGAGMGFDLLFLQGIWMTPKTRYRKNQKKAKRLKYRKCKCGAFYMICRMVGTVPVQSCAECGIKIERPWVGGGNGIRIPGKKRERGEARAGSNPAPPKIIK